MGRFAYSRGRWHAHVVKLAPPEWLRPWMTDRVSLTAKLTSACSRFRVLPIRETIGRGLGGECATMGLSRCSPLWQREVLLQCDDKAVVFARTVVPYGSLSGWPWLRDLGDNPLGSALFADSHVVRGGMQFASLHADHPIRSSMIHLLQLQYPEPVLYARRTKFVRNRNRMLVTEVFLPSIMNIET